MRPHLTRKFNLSTHWNLRKALVPASPKLRTLARALLPLVTVLTVIGLATAPAGALRRQDAMHWAMEQIGCPYVYGATGPCHNGYDCSGLVVAAYASVGMRLPRTTYEMLASRQLMTTTDPDPGNLVFFGDGHVALYWWAHVVLQAPEPGENVQLTRWYPGSDWVPTAYRKVRDAGNGGPMDGLAGWMHRMMTRYHLRIHEHTNLRDVFPRR